MDNFYLISESSHLKELITEIDRLKENIDNQRPLRMDIWETIQAKLRIEWTYDSNAIEGSTLSKGDTYFFLTEGLTVKGKPLKDFLDARNHAEAIDFLYDMIRNNRPIGDSLIKEINALLLSGVNHTPAIDKFGNKVKKKAYPGEYKKQPNHVLQLDGTMHFYTNPLQVSSEMQILCKWINDNIDVIHPLCVATIAHYNMVRIHPFDDGNGRGARILMNLILIKKGYPPAIIRNENRQNYLLALIKADKGDMKSFLELVAESLRSTQQMIIKDLFTEKTGA